MRGFRSGLCCSDIMAVGCGLGAKGHAPEGTGVPGHRRLAAAVLPHFLPALTADRRPHFHRDCFPLRQQVGRRWPRKALVRQA